MVLWGNYHYCSYLTQPRLICWSLCTCPWDHATFCRVLLGCEDNVESFVFLPVHTAVYVPSSSCMDLILYTNLSISIGNTHACATKQTSRNHPTQVVAYRESHLYHMFWPWIIRLSKFASWTILESYSNLFSRNSCLCTLTSFLIAWQVVIQTDDNGQSEEEA